MVYDSKSFVNLYGWWDNEGTLTYNRFSTPPINNYAWSIKTAKYDFDCGNIYLTYGPPLNKVSILYHDQTRLLNYIQFPIEVHTAVPVDEKKWIMAVFLTNNSVVFYNVTETTKHNLAWDIKPMPFLFQKNLTDVSFHNPFSRSTSLFYVVTDSKTQAYQLKCLSGIRLGMGLCLDTFDQAISQESKFQQLKFIFRAMKVMAFVIAFMQVTPLAGIFLRFINFWGICGIYSLVEVATVEPLTSILYQIYMLINMPLFEMLGINLSLSITKEQKVKGKYIQSYQMSSNFIGIIFQPFICTLIMCVVLYTFELIKKKFFSEKRKNYMSVSKFKIFFGQYVSFLSIFMFPLKFIYLSLNKQGYQEKWNSALNVIFICFSLVTPFMMILLNGKKSRICKKKPKDVNNQDIEINKSLQQIKKNCKKVKIKYITFENIEFSYVCLVNVLMPILGTFTNPYWFVIICGVLILFGVIVDIKRSDWRINAIIMSIQLAIFHVCFCLHLSVLSQKIRYTLSVICTVIIMIGAIHQIFTLIARIIVSFYVIFFLDKRKVTAQQTSTLKLQKNTVKSLVAKQINNTNTPQPTKLLKRQTKRAEQHFDKGIQIAQTKSLSKMTNKKKVKVEQITPGSADYKEIEDNKIYHQGHMSFEPKVANKKDPKQQNTRNQVQEIKFKEKETVKKSTFQLKMKFKKKNHTPNEMSLKIDHD